MEHKLKVLIVEDEAIIAMDIEQKLEQAGYLVIDSVSSFDEGIKSLSNKTPDVILMDIFIEGEQTGIDLAKRIAKDYLIPVIFVTSNTSRGMLSEVKKTNPYGFVSKPFETKDLVSAIEIAHHKFLYEKSLIESEKKLKELNDQLEKRVEERTKKLQNLNYFLQEEIKHRNEVEQSLFQSEQLYKNTFKNLGSGLIIADQDGQIISSNNAINEILNQKERESKHENIRTILNEEDWTDLLNYFKSSDENLWCRETKIRTNTEERIWANLYVSVNERNNGKGTFIISMIDINQQKINELLVEEERKKQIKSFINGEENERKRIAKDLHDGISQKLTAAKFSIGALLVGHEISDEHKEILEGSKLIIEETMQEVREISHNLAPSVLADYGLEAALDRVIDGLSENKQTKVSFTSANDIGRISIEYETALFRIAQESINNALKYANASSIDVELSILAHCFTLKIVDNGKGFNLSDIEIDKGKGINNIRERCAAIKAELIIDSKPKEGTKIIVNIWNK